MRSLRLALSLTALALAAAGALAQEPAQPLKPPDRSSPRATLKTFLESADALVAFMAREYVQAPTRANFARMVTMSTIPIESLDLSEVPPAARQKAARAAAVALYEVLSRIPLPPFDEVPDAGQVKPPEGKAPARWVIPDTEIALARVQQGPRSGEFLFSPDTVARAG